MNSIICPECKQTCTVRGDGGGVYGVHFAKVTDQKPCVMSYQSLKKETKKP